MFNHKHFNKICCGVLVICLLITSVFMNADYFGITQSESTNTYAENFFGETTINTIDIIVDTDTWHEMLDNASEKEYITCDLVINGENFSNIAIRTKGNSSLQQVQSSGSDRYSFKIEFDHYDSTMSYYGLDKLCLNNIVQDNTYMKDYLGYTLMNEFGVASPLVNYVNVSINGDDFGLYLAVEAIEDAFLQRNYGTSYGTLYKPETSSNAGGGGQSGGSKESSGSTMPMEDPEAMALMEGAMALEGNIPEMAEMPPEMMMESPEMAQPGSMSQGGMQQSREMPEAEMMQAEIPEDMAMPEMAEGQMGQARGQMTEGSAEMMKSEMPEAQMMQGGMQQSGQRGQMAEGSGMMQAEMSEMPEMPEDSMSQSREMSEMLAENAESAQAMPSEQGQSQERSASSGGKSGGMGGSSSSSTTLSSAFNYDGDDPDSYSYIFDNAVTKIDDSDKDRLIDSIEQLNEQENLEEVVDVEHLIRYFVVHNFLLNFDSYTGGIMHNYYLYEEDGVMTMLPWDYNLSFVSFQTSYSTEELANFPIDTPVSSGTVESRPMLSWIFSSEEYTELYHELFAEFIDQFFVSGYFEETVLATEALIDEAVENDTSKFCTYEQFTTGVDALIEFVALRVESIQGQLAGTIGSTAEAQAENPDALISTGDLDVTDTGSATVQTGKGNIQSPTRNKGGMPSGQMGGSQMMPGDAAQMGGEMPTDANAQMGEAQMPSGNSQMGQQMSGGGMPQMSGSGGIRDSISNVTESTGLSDTQVGLVASGIFLLAGFIIVFVYKRRKK